MVDRSAAAERQFSTWEALNVPRAMEIVRAPRTAHRDRRPNTNSTHSTVAPLAHETERGRCKLGLLSPLHGRMGSMTGGWGPWAPRTSRDGRSLYRWPGPRRGEERGLLLLGNRDDWEAGPTPRMRSRHGHAGPLQLEDVPGALPRRSSWARGGTGACPWPNARDARQCPWGAGGREPRVVPSRPGRRTGQRGRLGPGGL